MKLKLQKTKLKAIHIFYIGFFVLYGAGLYYFLYHINELSPFQINIHFFSNVIGSFSKRFLSETAPYALIFYLLYYTKALWKRIVLIAIFEVIFLINALAIGFYFITRSNFQFYILEGFNFHILFSFITLKIAIVTLFVLIIMGCMAYGLFLIKNKEKKVWLFKKRLITVLLITLTIGAPYIPIAYNSHISLYSYDSLIKKTRRTIMLDQSGLTILLSEFRHKYYPKKASLQKLDEDEEKTINSNNLDIQSSQNIDNPPKKIVLVIAESLNRQFISHYNKKIAGATPYLDSLFKKYPHVDDFYPSGPYTLQGVSAILCGHTNGLQTQKNPEHKCAPKLLAEAGFKNEFIRGASKYYVSENMHFKKFGFDKIFGKEDLEKIYPEFIDNYKALYKTWGYTDSYIFNEAIKRLKNSKSDEKLLLTLLTVDTHVAGGRCSYEKTEFDPKDPLLFSITCFDKVFKEFIEDLKNENLLDEDTVVILTADQLYPAYNKIPGDDFQTSFVLKPANIPFLMISGRDIDLEASQGSQIDIASTLLDLENIEIPSYYMGKSLISNKYAYPMGQDRQNGYLIIGNKFYSLSLNPSPFQKDTDGPKAFDIKISPDATEEELLKIVQTKIDEVNQSQNQEGAFFKWYYNKFYNLTM